jgi:hypothetical protein
MTREANAIRIDSQSEWRITEQAEAWTHVSYQIKKLIEERVAHLIIC